MESSGKALTRSRTGSFTNILAGCAGRRGQSPQRRMRRDNLALVPGDLLFLRAEWQEVANRLPHRAVLIVLPAKNETQKQTMLAVAKILAKEGHQIRVLPVADLFPTSSSASR